MATPIEVVVPDIGGFKDVDVIEVLVANGQRIEKETPLITLETEKAAMDVPAPVAGRVVEIRLKKGDKVSEGSLILLLEASGAEAPAPKPASAPAPAPTPAPAPAPKPAPAATPAPASKPAPAPAAAASAPTATPAPGTHPAIDEMTFGSAHASPSVRKFARELGANLGKISGTGPKNRITHDDVKAHVKALLAAGAGGAPVGTAGGSGLPPVPVVDFASFGPVEAAPLSRIQRISGPRLHASWLNLPHVTQYEEADITDLEATRNEMRGLAAAQGLRLTPLAFIIRAVIRTLQEYPQFNASLDPSGQNLILKRYFHIGFAADTPNGLVVPVIRNADRLSLFGLAEALAALSEKARAGKLTAADMQGGSFSISSLGGIGGTAFTPLINAPEVAILGVARSSMKPVYERGGFLPRLMLPLSLSYDHRVIDGAAGARFVVFLAKTLGDVKALL